MAVEPAVSVVVAVVVAVAAAVEGVLRGVEAALVVVPEEASLERKAARRPLLFVLTQLRPAISFL